MQIRGVFDADATRHDTKYGRTRNNVTQSELGPIHKTTIVANTHSYTTEVQLSVVSEKLNMVTDRGRRKFRSQLSVVWKKLGLQLGEVRKFNGVRTSNLTL